MKLARIGNKGAERGVVGIGDTWFDADQLIGDLDADFWSRPLPSVQQIAELPQIGIQGERWGCPLTKPPAIIGIGQNYAAHAAESGSLAPTEPIIFLKLENCLGGANDEVSFPAQYTSVDWEVELGVIIGKPAWRLADESTALDHVAGYVLANDLSERELQIKHSGGQWSKGKCLPGFAPLGPWVVTPDEFDPTTAELRSWVNGEPRQDSNTRDMIFPVTTLIHALSQFMRLESGTLILTGTPQGVAMSGKFPYLSDGDVVTAEIPGLGRQEFTLRAQ